MKKVLRFLIVLLVLGAAYFFSQRDRYRPAISGTLEADDARLAARSGGRVVRVLAEEGDRLEAGQALVVLEAPDLVARRDQAVALLAELEAGPRTQEIATARAEWQAAAAELRFARDEARRSAELFAKDVVPVEHRDAAASRAEALERRVEAAHERLELLRAGTRPERIDQARAQVAELNALVAELEVHAVTAGTLEVLHVKPGDVLAPNAPVATVLLDRPPWIRVYLPAGLAGRLQAGGSAVVRPDAAPDIAVTGVVEQISRKAEFTPRNVQTPEERIDQVFGIKVRLPAGETGLRAGMTATVSFP
jgi:multidrug resistance efflux pump